MEKVSSPYPAGTTKEQWDNYNREVIQHEQFIKNYKFFLDRVCRHLQFVDPNQYWTTGEIRKTILSEIEKSQSMDAPNKPGYYKANND